MIVDLRLFVTGCLPLRSVVIPAPNGRCDRFVGEACIPSNALHYWHHAPDGDRHRK